MSFGLFSKASKLKCVFMKKGGRRGTIVPGRAQNLAGPHDSFQASIITNSIVCIRDENIADAVCSVQSALSDPRQDGIMVRFYCSFQLSDI